MWNFDEITITCKKKNLIKYISPVSIYKHGDGVKSLDHADIVGGNLVKSKIPYI